MSRPETGQMEFEDDWCGVFIRGDNAAGFALALRNLLENNSLENVDIFGTLGPLQDLLNILESSMQHANDHRYDSSRQYMKKFENCKK